MGVSSLAGVPGAIPGGGVPGAGFFPGKGIWAVEGGASSCLQVSGASLGTPEASMEGWGLASWEQGT